MKKLYAIIIAVLITILCIVGTDGYIKIQLDNNANKAIYYNNIYTRNNCDYMMDKIISDNSIVVLGSSELSASDNLAYPPALFNYGESDFNMILYGAGYLQSLPQAINLAALDNNIKNRKVVLIVSPQWFGPDGLGSDAFSSRFSENNFVEFLRNKHISKTTKRAIVKRANELLVADEAQLKRAIEYESIYLDHNLNPINIAEMNIYSAFCNAKLRYELLKELNDINYSANIEKYVKADDIDFNSLLTKAEELGYQSCTNNEYGIYDEYFDKYIKDSYESSKDSSAGASYANSIEYDDLRLFLDVCKETGIEPMIVSVPVNGRWYDYTGFSEEGRQQYYDNIRNICSEYDVELTDFSDKEYEIYFLRDIMHMGWKGWVYLDEAVYEFYKK